MCARVHAYPPIFFLDTIRNACTLITFPLKASNAMLQVCLAAETCKHVGFDVRQDTWWSSMGFQCGNHTQTNLHYWNIVAKVLVWKASAGRQILKDPAVL